MPKTQTCPGCKRALLQRDFPRDGSTGRRVEYCRECVEKAARVREATTVDQAEKAQTKASKNEAGANARRDEAAEALAALAAAAGESREDSWPTQKTTTGSSRRRRRRNVRGPNELDDRTSAASLMNLIVNTLTFNVDVTCPRCRQTLSLGGMPSSWNIKCGECKHEFALSRRERLSKIRQQHLLFTAIAGVPLLGAFGGMYLGRHGNIILMFVCLPAILATSIVAVDPIPVVEKIGLVWLGVAWIGMMLVTMVAGVGVAGLSMRLFETDWQQVRAPKIPLFAIPLILGFLFAVLAFLGCLILGAANDPSAKTFQETLVASQHLLVPGISIGALSGGLLGLLVARLRKWMDRRADTIGTRR